MEGALHQVINHGSSVHHAGFLFSAPNKTPDIWAMSHDENLGVYRLHDMEGTEHVDEKKAFGDVRKSLECEYVVDVVTRSAGGAYIAAGSHSNSFVNLVSVDHAGNGLEGWGIGAGQAYQLVGAHGGEIVRSVLVDGLSGTIFTAGEDGLVMAWKPPTGTETSEKPVKEKKDRKEKKEKKDRKEKKEKKKERFNPY